MAGLNRSSWMAQRNAAQERESVVAELDHFPAEHQQSAARSVIPVSDSAVLDRITERLTSRLKEELRSEVMKEEQAASRKKASENHKMEVYLAAELEQTTCPICYEVMQPPEHTPTLLFPCGHTFCKGCLEGHVKANNRRTCPYCREKIQSQAPNMILQQLIDGFTTQKKAQAAAADFSDCVESSAAKLVTKGNEAVASNRSPCAEEEQENKRRSHLEAQLSGVSVEGKEQLELYIREWRSLNMRWKIYENEAIDCQQEMYLLQNKKDAGKLVQKHLQGELEDAKHRLEMIRQEIELINDQVEQQAIKDTQMESEMREKKRRQELVGATKEGLATERDKIRLMVKHFAPEALDIDAILSE